MVDYKLQYKKKNRKDYSYSSDIKKVRGRADWLYQHPTSFLNRNPTNVGQYKLHPIL